jgi:hypothetical protein
MDLKTENTIAALEMYGERIKDQMVENLFNNRSFNTGTLAKSITNTVDDKSLTATIAVNEWYGITVEEGIGRKAGRMPPIIPIQNWIRKKNLRPKAGATVEQFAWAIAKNIAKKGTNPKPKPFAAPAVKQVKENFGDEIIEIGAGEDIEAATTLMFKASTII